jgi:hypothetical protein
MNQTDREIVEKVLHLRKTYHLGGDHLAGLIEREEQRVIQQLVSHPAVEALDVAVSHMGLPGIM